VWLKDLDLEGKLAESTRALYEPEHAPTRDAGVRELPAARDQRAQGGSVIKRLASAKSYSTVKQARTVLSLAFGLAVRYDAIRENPVREAARLHKPPSQTMSLTLDQVEAIRDATRNWRRGPAVSGPPPGGQLEQIIEIMLGTSARSGEVLAIRRCDVDVTVSPATVRICGTIVSPAGKPTHRQPHPKTQKSTRVVSVPSFAGQVIREWLVVVGQEDPEHLLFDRIAA
jgi:integrase